MPTLTFPLSRIEGHARVVIDVEGGEVRSTSFQATEFRGFKYLVRGVPAEQMTVIVPRICGVCSTAHHIAAVKALEDAFGVEPPPLARRLRELLLLGQLIQNQATSLFIFTMPDRLGISGILDPVQEEHQDDRSQITHRALAVRRAGTRLITAAGGQFIHPVKAVVGGMTSGIDPDAAAALSHELAAALPMACDLYELYIRKSQELRDRLGTWGDDAPAHYMAAVSDSLPNYDGDEIRLLSTDGSVSRFPARSHKDYLTYEQPDYSYSGRTTYGGDALRANSLARVNLAESMGTPLADVYLKRFRDAFGRPAHAILLFDLARGIELVYAIERAMQILAMPLNTEVTEVQYAPKDGEGYGLVEAPRGPLIHHYVIEKGLIADAEFVIPTVHNIKAIERALMVAARRYITRERIDMELEQAVGRVVRAFDPCIACATH
ncbi:MAG: Ni/Fe hydrogenase subunit alpha [Chloroflexota bacterium]